MKIPDKLTYCNIISGGVSGAILDEESPEAEKHAELYYEEIRHMHTDVQKIADNTGYTRSQIQIVKDYLFMDEHEIYGEIRRFDSNFAIAESWRRLAFDFQNVKPHDFTLLKHEIMEMEMVIKGLPQDVAHDITSEKYNYPEESREYYRGLRILRHQETYYDKLKEINKIESENNNDNMERN